MKKIVLMLIAATGSFAVNAQKLKEAKVPENIRTALKKAYPNAEEIKWEKEEGNYEAEFEVKETEYSVVFNQSGNIIETETDIPVDQLPQSVKDYMAKHYPSQKIKEAAKITDAAGTITYEAEIKGKELVFDASGALLKEEGKH